MGKADFPPNFAASGCALCHGTGPCFPVFWRWQGHARSPLALVLGTLGPNAPAGGWAAWIGAGEIALLRLVGRSL